MKENLRKYKLYYLIIFYCLAVVLVFFLFLYPRYLAIREMADGIERAKLDKVSLENKMGEIDKSKEQDSLIKTNQALADGSFIEEGRVVDFVKELEKIAADLGVETKIQALDKQSIGGKSNAAFLEKVTDIPHLNLKIISEGDFSAQVSFINKIENLPNYLNIYSLKFEKVEDMTQTTARETIFQQMVAEEENQEKSLSNKITATLDLVVYLK